MGKYNTDEMDIDEILEWSKRMGLSNANKTTAAARKKWNTQSLDELLAPRESLSSRIVEKPSADSSERKASKEPVKQAVAVKERSAPSVSAKETAKNTKNLDKGTVKKPPQSVESGRAVKAGGFKYEEITVSTANLKPAAGIKPHTVNGVSSVAKKQWDTRSLNELLEPKKPLTERAAENRAVKATQTQTAVPQKPVADEKIRTAQNTAAAAGSDDGKTKIVDAPRRSAIEQTKYRERFMNIPVQTIEKTEDYEDRFTKEKHDPIERPGIVSRRNTNKATADLEPLPTIIPAEKIYNDEKVRTTHFKTKPTDFSSVRRVSPIVREDHEQDIIAGQIKLTGFEEKAVIERVDEAIEEQKLIASRKEKVKAFRLFRDESEDFPDEFEETELSAKPEISEYEEITSPTDDDDEVLVSFRHKNKNKAEIVHISDYNDPSDAKDILKGLKSKSRKAASGAAATLLVSTVLFVVQTLPYKIGLNLENGLNGSVFCCVNLLLILTAVIFSASTVSGGLKELFRGDPDADTVCTLNSVFALIQAGAGFFFKDRLKSGVFLYGSLAVFAFFLNYSGKYFTAKRVCNNFLFIKEKRATHVIKPIDNEKSAFEIGRGLLMGEPDVRYSVPIKFPSKFLELSYKSDPADRLSKKLLPYIFAGAIAIGAAYGFVKKDVFGAISLGALSFILGSPSVCLVATNLPFYKTGKALNKKGAMLSGYSAVADCGQANAVVFDSSDIFARGGCSILGIKTFRNMRIDEAILDAAAVVVEAGGPCGEVFDKVIEGRRELLPPVENLAYEDRLGLSAWIHGRRVLVGNRELLLHHNVEVPEKSSEDIYRHDGRQVMYLAVAGQLSALFVVGYEASADVGDSLRELDRNCVIALVRTSDANITEELISNFFGVNKNAVKVISAVAGSMYKDLKKIPLETADAAILHDGKINSFLSAVSSAISLNSSVKIPSILMIIAAALSMLTAAVVGLFFDITDMTVSGMFSLMAMLDFFIIISSFLHKK